MARVFVTEPAVAESVTDWVDVTLAAWAVKVALEDPLGTLTVAGSVTEEFELESATLRPPLPAAAESVTVQLSLPAPVIDELEQLSPLN